MDKNFDEFDWSAIKITDVFKVRSKKTGSRTDYGANTSVFQIGLKLSGKTKIFYGGEILEFYAGNAIYLPKEKNKNIEYYNNIIEQGESLCLFFDTCLKLPDKPAAIELNFSATGLFLKLYKAYNAQNRDYFECLAAFYQILSSLDKTLKKINGCGEDDMADVILYMNNHCTDKYIDLKYLADMQKISVDSFRHKFKKIYNIPPLQYYNEIKLQKIKQLICQSEHTLTEIAEMTGFSDLNYFSRFFKKYVKMPPSEYRKYCLI